MLLSCINQIIPILNDAAGYGYGVLIVLSMPASIIFGLPALLLYQTFKSEIKANKGASSTFRCLCFFLFPSVMHWIILLLGTIFKIL